MPNKVISASIRSGDAHDRSRRHGSGNCHRYTNNYLAQALSLCWDYRKSSQDQPNR